MSQLSRTSALFDPQEKISAYKYQVTFNEANGETTWDPPRGSPALIRALAVHFPELGSTSERMSVALAQHFDGQAPQDRTSSPQQSLTTPLAPQQYQISSVMSPMPALPGGSGPISRQSTLVQSVATPGSTFNFSQVQLGKDSNGSSMISRTSSPKPRLNRKGNKRQLTDAGRERARVNRLNNATCEVHRQTKVAVRTLLALDYLQF
jgi:hypothetical protein